MKKKWEYYELDTNKVEYISRKFNVSELLAKVLINRNISGESSRSNSKLVTDSKGKETDIIINDREIEVFLNPTRNDFYNPFLMPDMEKAVDRIIQAIDKKEKVIIYGDYDVDGITSITVLKQFLEERGLNTEYYVPNRLEEGYGLNKEALEQISKNKYTLMITVDCGISSIEEIEMCNSLGFDTIITDHHEQLEELPNAYAIVNHKRRDNQYPFRGLAGVGVVFKLIQAISIKLGLEEKEFLKYLDLVCLGTISDIVPLVDENRVIAKLGLKLIEVTKNIGLKELLISSGYKEINTNTVSFGLAPRINACGRMGYQYEALRLFLTNSIQEAKEITVKLNEYNQQRQAKEKEIFEQAIDQLENIDLSQLSSIVLSGDKWHHGVIRDSCFKANR